MPQKQIVMPLNYGAKPIKTLKGVRFYGLNAAFVHLF